MMLQINGREIDIFHALKQRERILLRHESDAFTTRMLIEFARLFRLQTVTEGWQLWAMLDQIANQATAEQQLRAEIAYAYKINAFELHPLQLLVLRDSLPRLRAQDAIQRGQYDPCDYDGVYRLFLAATGDEELANKKKTESFALFVEKKTKS